MTAPPLPPIFNPTFLALGVAIVVASGLGLWWLLRGESRTTLLVLALCTALSLALRVAYTTDYPRGLNEDEPKVLYAAGVAVARGTLLAESNISVPILPHALFQGQLIPLLGAGRWAIRAYSLIGGVLATPAAFAVARAIGLAVAPSLAGGAFVAVLPWSMFYSRVMTGGELTFFQLLLLAALARLIWRDGGWRAAALGGFALTWLLYGYWCTRAMLPMPVLAAALASGRRRLWCLAISAVAVALYAPYVVANRHSMFIWQGVDPSYYAGFGGLVQLAARSGATLATFVRPVGEDGWLTVRAGAMHPWLVLGLALLGLCGGVRRALFLGLGFLAGLAPAALAWGAPSTHRMLMAFPFIALAAAGGLDLLRPPLARRAASLAAVVAAACLSLGFYFGEDFWPPDSQSEFDWQRTELIESLPAPPQPVVFMRQISFFRDPRRLLTGGDQELSVDNWLPDERGATYAFSREAAPLRPLYEHLLGAAQVRPFGATFTATFPPHDWSFLRRHGWAYAARCATVERHGQVPLLFQPSFTFADFFCEQAATHVWRGRWLGAAAHLRLHAGGAATIDTPRARAASYERESWDPYVVDVAVEPGDEITVTVTTPGFQPWVYATLLALTPAGEQVPAWDSVEPLLGE